MRRRVLDARGDEPFPFVRISADCLLVLFDLLLLSFVEENTRGEREGESRQERRSERRSVICAGSMGDFFHRRLFGSGVRF